MQNMFGAIEKVSATQQVAQKLKEAILSGKLPLGSKLPSERDLAAQLGVSRPVLREAIVMLSSYGLLQSKQGEGNFVVDNFSESVLMFMGFDSSLNRENYQFFFGCRKLFEVGMVEQIIQNASGPEIRELIEINQTFSKDASSERYIEAETQFHRAFIALARNPLILELYSIVLKFMETSASYLLATAPIRMEAFEAHGKIIEALCNRDYAQCCAAVKGHLSVSEANLNRYYQESRKQASQL